MQLLQAQKKSLGQKIAQLWGDARARVTPAEVICDWPL